jgi:hypothetical protein
MKTFLLSLGAFVLLSASISAQPSNLVWTQSLGGSSDEPVGLGAGTSGAPAIAAQSDNEGNIYIATYTESNDGDVQSNAGSEDIWVLKLNSAGDTVWTRTFGGESFERCYALKILSDGNLLVAGKTASNGGNLGTALGGEDALLLKISQDGNLLWSRRYGGTLVETFFGASELPNGDLLACGITGSIDGDIQNSTWVGANKAWVMRLQPNGTPIWSRITNGLINNEDWEESFWYVQYRPEDQRIYCLGASYNFNDVNSDDLFLCVLNESGVVQNRYTYGSTGGDSPAGLHVQSDGSMLLLGTIRGGGQNVSNFMGGNADTWLLKVSNAGAIVWEKTFGGSGLDYAFGLSTDPSGNAVMVGSTRSNDNTAGSGVQGLFDGWLAAVNGSGDTLYVRRYGSSQNDHLHALLTGPTGDFYLVGRSQGSSGDVASNAGETDLWIMRREGDDVTLLPTSALAWSLSPNPIQSGQTLRWSRMTERVELVDLGGRVCATAFYANELQVPAHLPSGIYVLRSELGSAKVMVE